MTVATAILTTGASAVPICPLTNDHFDGIRNFRNYAHWGVEGLIAPAFGSEVFNAYRSQILVWVGVLDARQNLAGGFAGCYGSDCQIQIGNIKGTISDTFGGFYGTFAVNPYIEEYDKNGYFVRVFNDIPLASSASRYTVYDTGIVDTAGFHMLQGNFNNGSGYRLLGAGWYNQGRDFQITAVAEMANFDPNQRCPNVFHQEVGTFGYGTYQNYYSNVNLYERDSRNLVSWDFISDHFMDAPYFDGFFRQYGAWNVETRP